MYLFFFFEDTPTYSYIQLGVMSCNFSFIFDCPILCKIVSFIFDSPIICKTVNYTDQSYNSFWCVFGFDTYSFCRLIADWPVENMNPDITPNGMSLDVSISQKKNLILIGLIYKTMGFRYV
jgi:hypothetical protein